MKPNKERRNVLIDQIREDSEYWISKIKAKEVDKIKRAKNERANVTRHHIK